jgi:uncharacterized membrane protein YoaT (DUF817 family)
MNDWACLFGGAMVGLLIATSLWYPRAAAISRYDFLFLAVMVAWVNKPQMYRAFDRNP